MPGEFRGGQPLKHLFHGDNLFQIPDFQRDYAWTGSEVADLLSDLGLTSGTGETAPRRRVWQSPYFLGQIVLLRDDADDTGYASEPVADPDIPRISFNGTPADVIDGQQRLTTLTVLLACLRDRIADQDRRSALHAMIAAAPSSHAGPNGASTSQPGLPGLPVLTVANAPESRFLRDCVQSPGATLDYADTCRPSPHDDAPLKRLKHALERIGTALSRFDQDDLAAFADFLRERCVVAIVITSDRVGGWDVFSRLNKRGRPLLESERLKSDILRDVPEPRRSQLVTLWDRRKRLLGAGFDSGEVRRKDLFSYIRDHHAPPGGRTEDRIFALAQAQGPERFMDEVFEPMSRALAEVSLKQFMGPSGEMAGPSKALGELLLGLELAGRVMSVSSMDVQDAWKAPVLLYFAAVGDDREKKLAFLRQMDRHLHLLLVLHGKRNKHNVSKQLEALSVRIKSEGADLDFQHAFVIPNAKQVMHNLTTALDGNVAKLILLRAAASRGEVDLEDGERLLGRAYNIEHVLPERMTTSWVRTIGNEDQARKLKTSLGNLFITSQRLNSKLGNKSWPEKHRLLRQADVLMPFPEHAREASAWDRNAIEGRRDAIISVLDRMWNVTGKQRRPSPKAPATKQTSPARQTPDRREPDDTENRQPATAPRLLAALLEARARAPNRPRRASKPHATSKKPRARKAKASRCAPIKKERT